MSRPKCMSPIHRDLAANRREAAEARNEWAVYRLTKKGTQGKRPEVTCGSEAEAIERAERMTELNPGITFVAGRK